MAKKKAKAAPAQNAGDSVAQARAKAIKEISALTAARSRSSSPSARRGSMSARSSGVSIGSRGILACEYKEAEAILLARGHLPSVVANELRRREDVDKVLASVPTPAEPAPPPLSPVAAAMYELLLELPAHRAMTGKEIADELNRRDPKLLVDESALRGRHATELQAYGLENRPRIGYRISPAHRPPAK